MSVSVLGQSGSCAAGRETDSRDRGPASHIGLKSHDRSRRPTARAKRHGFEYFRHGTLSLYAAFNTKTGKVLGKTSERHTSAEFVVNWPLPRTALDDVEDP